MAKKYIIVCDGCGREELQDNTKNWIFSTVKVGGGPQDEIQVCSFACLGRYSMRKESELHPDQ